MAKTEAQGRPHAPEWKRFKRADGPFEMIPTPAYEIRKRKSDPSYTGIYGQLLDSLSLTSETNEFVHAASVMAITHNIILRGLNSIYLQADLVKEEQVKDFVGYCLCWTDSLGAHHNHEESFFFPEIERLSGMPGIMEVNVQQHEEFQAGLHALTAHLRTLASQPPTAFSAPHIRALIDDFAPALHQHMFDEIPSLLSLAPNPSVPMGKLMAGLAAMGERDAPKTTQGVMFFLNQDLGFEEGMWRDWPPIPWVVRRGVIGVLG